MKQTLLFCAAAMGLMLGGCKSADYKVTSPDGRIVVEYLPSKSGNGAYSVVVDGDTLLRQSRLGLVAQGQNLEANKILEVTRVEVNETWTQPWGENKQCTDNHREMAIALSGDGAQVTLRFRVFDDGMALRYEIDAPVDSLTIMDELTEFNFAVDGDTWSYPANFETYELNYRRMHLSDIPDSQTPCTFRTNAGVYGSIHEAALYDYPEMVLRRDSVNKILKADLAPLPNGVKAYIPGKFTTPPGAPCKSDARL